MPETAEPLRFTLAFRAPETHYVEVEASVPTGGAPAIELMQPVWTPGSYRIRDYPRHVEELRAESGGGNALPLEKTRKNRWRVTTWGAPRVTLSYRVYGREMTVRTNFIEADFALINGAPTFLTLDDGVARPHEVAIVLPAGWERVLTALDASPHGGPHLYVAPDHETLVDSPIYAGSAAVYPFEVDGVPHLLANEGEGGVWDGPRSAADVARIVEAARRFWGGLPYRRYLFLNLITEAAGGLEHRDSTVLMTSRWKARTREAWLEWLGLVAHEHFHAWNVKRLRPRELGPFDYDAENYTRTLWVAEGVTSYYDDLLVHRAGLSTREEYLRDLSKTLRAVQKTPGRRVQTLEAASYDTWIKYYQPDENTPNTAISYYTKGASVSFLLDARIRAATAGERSLDDVMRLAWERFLESGFTTEEFEALAAEVAGEDLGDFFDRALRSTDELDFAPALQWLGLRFAPQEPGTAPPAPAQEPEAEGVTAAPREPAEGAQAKPPPAGDAPLPQPSPGAAPAAGAPVETAAPRAAPAPTPAPTPGIPEEPPGWLGATTRVDNGRLVVTEVRRGTPAHAAGVAVEDEILALDDYRVPPDRLPERLKAYRPGDSVTLLVARRERLVRLDAQLGRDPGEGWRLQVDPEATEEQRQRLAAWLAG